MWIKTDSGELVNLDHYQKLKVERKLVESCVDGNKALSYAGDWQVIGITHNCWDSAIIAICETKEEAHEIIDTINSYIGDNVKAASMDYLRKERQLVNTD